jgi:hypothetical protein
MRLFFNAGKDTLNALKAIQSNYKEPESMGTIVVDSIAFLFQMETLMDAGYKLAIVDPEGKQHIISKRNMRDEENEDYYDGPPENED